MRVLRPDCCWLCGLVKGIYTYKSRSALVQIRDSIDLPDAMRSYFGQLFPLNPGAIVPGGPTIADLGLDSKSDGTVDGDAFFHQAL